MFLCNQFLEISQVKSAFRRLQIPTNEFTKELEWNAAVGGFDEKESWFKNEIVI